MLTRNENLALLINPNDCGTCDDKNMKSLLRRIEEHRHSKKRFGWPVKRRRIIAFHGGNTIQDLCKSIRLANGTTVCHEIIRYDEIEGGRARSTCVLCDNSKQGGKCQTRYWCSICKVPLCCTRKKSNEVGSDNIIMRESCFELWHRADNLIT